MGEGGCDFLHSQEAEPRIASGWGGGEGKGGDCGALGEAQEFLLS